MGLRGAALFLSAFFVCTTCVQAVERVKVAQIDNPYSLAFMQDGSFLVSTRKGELKHVTLDGKIDDISGVPQVNPDELRDVVRDGDQIYLAYLAGPDKIASMTVMRATLKGNALVDEKVIFIGTPYSNSMQIGGKLLVQGDYIFLTTGDRWNSMSAQDLHDTAGKILRIKTDGSSWEVWSYGHRNPYGLAVDDQGRMWETENGPQGGDELNLIERGKNYGWPLATFGVDYTGMPVGYGTSYPGTEQPKRHWTPCIAPSGLAARGDTLFMGALRGQMILKLTIKDGDVVSEEHLFQDTQLGRVRDVRLDPHGTVYFITDDGALYRIEEHAGS